MAAAASIEHNGVPVDVPLLGKLRDKWDSIKGRLIAQVDQDFGVFEDGSFKAARFAAWLSKNGIPWPRLATGNLELGDEAFRQAARTYPSVVPLRELRFALSKL